MAAQMTCQEFVELVTAYLDEALDVETTARFEQHLALCPGCVTYVEQFRATIERVGDAQTPPTLSAETEASLMAAFRTWHDRSAH